MVATLVTTLLEQDREWLCTETGVTDVTLCMEQIGAVLLDSVNKYSLQLGISIGRDAQQSPYMARLWRCLRYHWRKALKVDPSISVHRVVAHLEEERGFPDGADLGGNPLRDVLLAEAVVQKDTNAVEIFDRDYRALAWDIARRYSSEILRELDDWWPKLLCDLGGFTGETPRLASFDGRSGLPPWLRIVIRNYLRLWRRRMHRHASSDLPWDLVAARDQSSVDQELLTWLGQRLKDILADFNSVDRLMLAWKYCDGLSQRDIARLLGICEGQISRRLKAARDRLCQKVKELIAELPEAGRQGLDEEFENFPREFERLLDVVLKLD